MLSLVDKQALLLEQQTNNVSVKSMASEVRNPEKGTGEGIFIGYVAYVKGSGKINVQSVVQKESTGCNVQTATITQRSSNKSRQIYEIHGTLGRKSWRI